MNKVEQFPSYTELNEWLSNELQQSPLQTDSQELAVALLGISYLEDQKKNKDQIEKLVQWCTCALTSDDAENLITNWTSFSIPKRLIILISWTLSN